MKRILTFVLLAIFTAGLISCSAPAEKSGSEPQPTEAANKSDSDTSEKAPGTTPDEDTKGKSDADK